MQERHTVMFKENLRMLDWASLCAVVPFVRRSLGRTGESTTTRRARHALHGVLFLATGD